MKLIVAVCMIVVELFHVEALWAHEEALTAIQHLHLREDQGDEVTVEEVQANRGEANSCFNEIILLVPTPFILPPLQLEDTECTSPAAEAEVDGSK